MTTKHSQFDSVLTHIIPHLGGDVNKTALLEVMASLKLEGLIGESLTDSDRALLRTVYQSVIDSPEKKDEAISLAEQHR